jgi:hypothetical protein
MAVLQARSADRGNGGARSAAVVEVGCVQAWVGCTRCLTSYSGRLSQLLKESASRCLS